MIPALLVIGGTGGVGRVLAELLLRETTATVIIAGRTHAHVDATVAELRAISGERVLGRTVNLADDDLVPALEGSTCVIHVTTATEAIPRLADACIRTRTDLIDLSTQDILRSRADAIAASGCCIIAQAGFHPGLPAAFVREAARQLTPCRSATLAMAMRATFRTPESAVELVDMLADGFPEILTGGTWRRATFRDAHTIDLGPPFGTRPCFPIAMHELHRLPSSLGLTDVGAYVAGFGGLADFVLTACAPLATALYRIRRGLGRRPLAHLIAWTVNRSSAGKPSHVTFLVEAAGEHDGRPQRLRIIANHPDPYAFTAIPVVACALQYLDGSIRRPGLHDMGNLVDPARLFADMERMGVRVSRAMTDASHPPTPRDIT